MLDRRGSYEYEDLLACGRGELFGAGNAQLAAPFSVRLNAVRRTGL